MVRIRAAKPADAGALVPLMRDYYAGSPVPHEFDAGAMAAHFAELAGPNPLGGLLVAEDDSGLVGFAVLYFTFSNRALRRILIINDLFVAAAVRRQGIARQLMTASFEWGQAHDCVSVEWVTRTSNVGAQKLYDELAPRETGWIHYHRGLDEQ